MKRRQAMLAWFCALMVTSAVVSALLRIRKQPSASLPQVPTPHLAPHPHSKDGRNPARAFSNAIADAVEKVMPSVVVIRTEKIYYALKRNFFGFTYRIPAQLAGQGSGVIIDELGHVITSWHVIDGARAGEVVLDNGTKLPVELIGFDKASDLAVLRIRSGGMGFQAVEFGDSDAVRVGELAIAIGSPFSLQSSVTVGYISQKGRKVRILPYEDFIQTDAAINEGNSGGPLIDVDGHLIGINTAKKTDDQERSVGIAFAVPSNLAMAVARSIIETGHHEWPWLGISLVRADPQNSDVFGGASIVISQVWNNTPAARANLQPGLGIIEIDGVPVQDMRDIERTIYRKGVGENVTLTLQSGKERLHVDLELEAFPGPTG